VSGKELTYYRAHFREAVQKDGVICLECGATFKFLPAHLCKHNLSSHEYRAKWGYNRTTPLERLRTRRKRRRNALAMKLWRFSPRSSLQKATKAIRGRPWPYRPESRLNQTEAARARLAASLRLAELKGNENNEKRLRHIRSSTQTAASRFTPSKEDRKILSLRKRGLWASQIASRLGIDVRSVLWRFQRLTRNGFTIPRPTRPRPTTLRKVTDEERLAVARSGYQFPRSPPRLEWQLRLFTRELNGYKSGVKPPRKPLP
jgi:ROS/MUCR transcriptional regulator protein